MKKILLLATLLITFGFVNAQYMYDGSGRQIGKIDGNLGDDIITSTNPNINQSGGNSSFNTISNSSPYIVLTFIIKAKK